MTDDNTTLREPLLPPGGDDQEDEEHTETSQPVSSSAEGREFLAEFRETNDQTEDDLWPSSSELYYPPESRSLAKRNIRTSHVITFFSSASRSIWSQSLLSIFVILVWKDCPEYVGYVPATIGIAQTISSAATQWATRRFDFVTKRTGIVLLVPASLLGIVAMALSLYVIANHASNFGWFLAANGLWGLSWGTMESSLPVVFVESASVVPKNTQQTYKTSYQLGLLGGVSGTVLALGFFQRLGNEWSIASCLLVMTVGVACNLPVVILLCFLRSMALGEESTEAFDEEEAELATSDEEILEHENSGASSASSTEEWLLVPEADEIVGESGSNTELETSNLRVPLMINIADAVSSLAGGMSTWYFPVFLVRYLDLGPVWIQLLCLVIPLGQWLSPMLARIFERALGPCRACILMQWMYVAFLLSMISCQRKGLPLWTICSLYVLQSSLMNSTSALSRALIEYYVLAEDEYRWNILTGSLQKLLWSCACLLGGFVVSRWGLLANFYSTATLQLLAGIPLVILYFSLDPRLDAEQKSGREEDENESGDEETGVSNNNLLESETNSQRRARTLSLGTQWFDAVPDLLDLSGHDSEEDSAESPSEGARARVTFAKELNIFCGEGSFQDAFESPTGDDHP